MSFLIHEALTYIAIINQLNSQRIGYNVTKYKKLFGSGTGSGSESGECTCCPKEVLLEIPLLDDIGLTNETPGKSNLIYGLSLIELIKDSYNMVLSDAKAYFNELYKPIVLDFMEYADQQMKEYSTVRQPNEPTPEALVWNGGDGNLSRKAPSFTNNKEYMTFQKKYIGNVTESFMEEFKDASYSLFSAGYPTEIYKLIYNVKNLYDVDGRIMTTLGINILMAVCDNYLMALRRSLHVDLRKPKDRVSALGYEYSFIQGILDFNNFYFNFFEKLRAIVWLKKVLTRILGEFPYWLDKRLNDFAEELAKYKIYWDIEDTGCSNVNLGIINIWSYKKTSENIRRGIFSALNYARNLLVSEYRVKIRSIKYLISEAMTPKYDFYIKTSPSFRKNTKAKIESGQTDPNINNNRPEELKNNNFWKEIFSENKGINQ